MSWFMSENLLYIAKVLSVIKVDLAKSPLDSILSRQVSASHYQTKLVSDLLDQSHMIKRSHPVHAPFLLLANNTLDREYHRSRS